MTTIDRLQISGIRAFDPNTQEVIKFFKPLTIIVGRNGSGKTTIVEALKFACTGTNPPNSNNGKSFVHDPKYIGDAIVKGQIKVSFKTGSNKPVIVIRSFQLTQKKSSRTLRQIDGVLRTINADGKQITMSHKCAEMEQLVPQLMGVSKAILTNVIFCHQEDSSWPLGDPKSLKTKFDDIFASTRYSKALENIRKFRVTQGKMIRDLQRDLSILSNNMETAQKFVDNLDQVKALMADYEEVRLKLSEDIQDSEDKLSALKLCQDNVNQLKIDIRQFEFKRDTVKQDRERIFNSIETQYDESEENLLKYRDEFHRKVQGYREASSAAQLRLRELARQREFLTAEINESHKQAGKMQAEEENNKANLEKASILMTDLASAYKIDGASTGNATFELLQEFVPKLGAIAKRQKGKYIAHKRQYEEADRQMDRQLVISRGKHTALLSGIDAKKETRRTNRVQLQKYETQLHDIKLKLQNLADISEQISKAEGALSRFKSNPEHARVSAQIDSKSGDSQRNINKMETLETEMKALRTQAEAAQNLKFKREQTRKKEHEFQAALDGCKDAVAVALGGEDSLPEPKRFGDVMNESIAEMENVKRKISRELQSQKENLGAFDGQLRTMNHELNRIKREMSEKNERLQRHKLKGKSIADMIKESEDILEKNRREKTFQEGALTVFSRFLEKAQNQRLCPMCERNLTKKELEHFVTINADRAGKFDQNRKAGKFDTNIQKERENIENFRKLQPLVNDIARLKNEASDKKESISSLTEERIKVSRVIAKFQGQDNNMKRKEQSLRFVQRDAAKVSRLFRELQNAKDELGREEYRLKAMAGGRRSYEEAREEHENLQKLNRDVQKALNVLRRRKEELLDERQSLQNKLTEAREKGLTLKSLQSDKHRIEHQYRSLTKLQEELIKALKAMDIREPTLRRDVHDKEEERSDLKKSFNLNEANLLNESRKAEIDVQNFNRIVLAIRQYRSLESARRAVYETIKRCTEQVGEIDEKKSEKEKIYQLNTDKIQNSNKFLSDLNASIQVLQKSREIRKYNKAIDAKFHEIELVDDYDKIDENVAEETKSLSELRDKKSEATGGLTSYKKQALGLMDMINSDRYKDVDIRYKQTLIRHETNAMAHEDLEKYYKALDKALIQFHAMKMQEINQTLKSLWQTVYRGHDIDEIALVSSVENVDSTRRNYSYSVVMKQGDVELEMRGRSSAGQRVLASLLIRLALAETFCVNCGVLALDEPTTNLDEHNVVSFAESLNQIIKRRRDQKSFQLIVITHDEHFVELLGKRDHCDFYYRIYKDVHQHSKIQRQSVLQ
uniref:DNA repair protein RAD50 n=1 Tax=Hirondellea gigas TaxID=1518452 RepID=A0A6A7G4P2_9CRUS